MIIRRFNAMLLCLLLSIMQRPLQGAEPDDTNLRSMIDLYCVQITRQLASITSVEYDTEIHQKLEPNFAAWKIKWNPSVRDYVDCTFKTHVSLKDDLYRWSTIGKSNTNGNVFENTEGGWSGVYSQHMINGADATLFLSKEHISKPPAAFIGRNTLFQPFSFLISDNDEFNKSACTLQQVKSQAVWETFKSAIKNISRGKCGDQDCLIVTVQYKPDTSTVVYFPLKLIGPPLGLDYYALNFHGHDKVLTYHYRLIEVGDNHLFPIPYAKTAETIGYMPMEPSPDATEEQKAGILKLNPEHKGTVEVGRNELHISDIKINSITDDSIFSIDPSSAHKIYDVDTGKIITVPR